MNLPRWRALAALIGQDENPVIGPPDNAFYASGNFVGSPANYRFTGDGFGYGGNAGLPYSQPLNNPDTMWTQPAFAIFPPMAPHYNPPDCDRLREFYDTPGGGLPEFFRPANRAAAGENGQSGQPMGIYMMLVPPDRFNATARAVRKPNDVRLQAARPSRARTPSPPVGG